MTFRLPTYVRARRKRLQLSQGELAYLLGLSSQAVISQHESLARLPQTKVLLKYEVLFDEPIGALFPKLRREAEEDVVAKLTALIARLEKHSDIPAARKVQLLTKLMHRLDAQRP